MDIGSLTGRIELENAASDVLKQVNSDLERFGQTAERQLSKIQGYSSSLLTFGKAASLAVTGPIVAMGGAAVAAGLQIEGAMNAIARKSGESGAALEGLQKDFENVFAKVPNAAEEVALAITDVHTRLGLTGKTLQDVTKQFLDFANVNQVDVAPATRSVATIVKALELDVKDAGTIMDKLTYASQKSGLSVTRLADGVIQGGIAFKEMGFGLDESIALFSKFEQVGANVTDVTSSLHRTLARLAKEGATDAKTAFAVLLEEIKTAPTFMDATRLSIEAFGAKAGPKLVEEIRGGTYEIGNFVAALQKLQGHTDATSKRSESFAESLGTLRNQATLLLAPLGIQMLGAMRSMLPAISNVISVLSTLTSWFSKLPGPIQTVTFGFLALAAAVGPVSAAIGALTKIGVIEFFLSFSRSIGLIGPAMVATVAPTISAKQALMAFTSTATGTTAVVKDMIVGMTASGVAANANFIASQKMIAGMSAVGTAAATTAGEVGALSVALRALNAIPVIAAITGITYVLYKLVEALNAAKNASDNFKDFVINTGHMIIYGNVIRDTAKSQLAASDSAKALYDQLSGKDLANRINDLHVAIAAMNEEAKKMGRSLNAEELRRFGEAAKSIIAESNGKGIHSNIREVADAYKKQEEAMLAAARASHTLEGQVEKIKSQLASLTPVQKAQIIEADKYHRSAEEIANGLKLIAGQAPISEDAIQSFLDTTKKGKSTVDDFARSLKDLTARLSGAEALQQLRLYQEGLKAIGGDATKLDKNQLNEYTTGIKAIIDKLQVLGPAFAGPLAAAKALASQLPSTARSLMTIVGEMTADGFKPFIASADEANKVAGEIIVSLDRLANRFRSSLTIIGNLGGFMGKDVTSLTKEQEDALIQLRGSLENFEKQHSFKALLGDALSGAFSQIPGIVVQGIIHGSSALQIASAVGSQLGAAIGKMIGATLGKFGGPIGEAIGSLLGPAIAAIGDALSTSPGEKVMKDVGRRWGASISEGLGDQIARDAKRLFGSTGSGSVWSRATSSGNTTAAEIFNLDKILESAGGLSGSNFNTFVDRLGDTFIELQKGAITSAQAVQLLDKSFRTFTDFMGKGLLPQNLRDIIRLTREYGLESKAIQEFLKGQSDIINTGFKGIVSGQLSGLDGALSKIKDINKQIDDEKQRIGVAGGKDLYSEELPKLYADLAKANAALKDVKITQSDFDRLGRLAMASFGSALDAGKPFLEALGEISDQLNVMNTAADTFKFKQIGAFSDLSAIQRYIDKHKEVGESITGTDKMLSGLYNSSRLTQESFSDLASIALGDFNKLTSGGLTTNQALMAQQGTLQTLWEIVKTGTLKVDDQTAALLKQAEAAGFVGDAHRDAQEKAVSAMQDAADAMTSLSETMQKFFDRISGGEESRSAPSSFANRESQSSPFARAGDSSMAVNMVVQPGAVVVNGANRNADDLADEIAPRLVAAVRIDKNGVRTRFRNALGVTG